VPIIGVATLGSNVERVGASPFIVVIVGTEREVAMGTGETEKVGKGELCNSMVSPEMDKRYRI
jgi:hypothetical protein